MRRLLYAASIAIILGGCDPGITGTEDGDGDGPVILSYIQLKLPPSGNGILSLDDDSQVEDLLKKIWTNQQSMAGIQTVMGWARDIASGLDKPDVIDMEVSVIIVPGDGLTRLDPDPDTTILTAFLEALEVEGVFYKMQGDQIQVEEPYNLTMRDGEEMPITIRVIEYTLVHQVLPD